MILIVAPYTPPNRVGMTHLGAARKLETIVSILSRLDKHLVLVNSAHNDIIPAQFSIRETVVAGVNLVEVTPPLSSNRMLGKLKNIFSVDHVLEVVKKFGRPQLIWFYNGYAFEMRFASKARKEFNVPMILEFEDWHFSRRRGFNPKPYIDYFFWRRAARFMSGSFVVNAALANKMAEFTDSVVILPGIVPKVLADIAVEASPFSVGLRDIHVGFFGGLSPEKGADIVLELVQLLPLGFVIHVTGSGPLADDFLLAQANSNGRLRYHGRVDDVMLYKLISECDVMLNPHASIESMNNGVFPFKVIEAVASGRLLITTQLPSEGLEDVLVGVQFVEHTVQAFYSAILGSRQCYEQSSKLVRQGAVVANQRFGENALLEKIKKKIQPEWQIN